MRGHVVVAVEPGEQTDLHVVEGAELTDVIQALLAQSAPESLHLAAGPGVMRFGVEEADAEPAAERGQCIADIGGPVVSVQSVGAAMEAKSFDREQEHLAFSLRGAGLNRNDIPAVVVE